MSRGLYYLLAALCILLGLLGAFRAVELLVFGGTSARNIGQVVGGGLVSILFLYGASRALKKARGGNQ